MIGKHVHASRLFAAGLAAALALPATGQETPPASPPADRQQDKERQDGASQGGGQSGQARDGKSQAGQGGQSQGGQGAQRPNDPQGGRNQGDRPRGGQGEAGQPRGERPQGDRPQGDRPQGDRPRQGGQGQAGQDRNRGAQGGQAGWAELLPRGEFTEHWATTGNWQRGEDGSVALVPREGEKGWTRWTAYLWSNKRYDDFEIEFDYKVQKGGNSGFYFNVGDKNDPVATGVEVQIYASHEKGDGKLTDHDSGGVIPGVPPTANPSKPAGEWNTFRITVEGDKLTVNLNGQTVNEVDLTQGKLADRPKSGYIGFQDHGLPLALRNIRVREL